MDRHQLKQRFRWKDRSSKRKGEKYVEVGVEEYHRLLPLEVEVEELECHHRLVEVVRVGVEELVRLSKNYFYIRKMANIC